METKAALVYQAGIANVFKLTPNGPERLMQADFRSCETFAAGLATAGWNLETFACNKAGDIRLELWDTPLEEAPFRESFRANFARGF